MNRGIVRLIFFIFFIGITFYFGNYFNITQEQIDSFLGQFPKFFTGSIFILLYVVGTFFIWYLKDILKIVGAILFGPILSSLFIYIAEIINAAIFFHISNFLANKALEKILGKKFMNFNKKLVGIPTTFVFLLRAVPLIPFRVLDLSFGLSGYPFIKYLTAVIIASPIRIFWIQYILAGARGFSIEKIQEYFLNNPQIVFISFFYFIFALIVGATVMKKININPEK